MKKVFKYFLVFGIIFSFTLKVDAQDFQKGDLIPVGTAATVDTELFIYKDFIYNAVIDDKGNSEIFFGSIKNKGTKKVPVSVNILLFDAEKKNIGFLTYCTDKDVESNYAQFELRSNQEAPFSISVSKKYFVEGKTSSDIQYISLLDENKYCQIGGYDKYKGLTIEEITDGSVASQFTEDGQLKKLMLFFRNKSLMIIIFTIVIVIVIYAINGLILNALYKRIYAKTTAMAYIPFLNIFLSVKLAFGELISKIFIGCYLVSILLTFMKITFLSTLVNFVSGISFIVVIIKLITKKYDLFCYSPSMKVNSVNNNMKFVNSNNGDNSNSKNSNNNNFFESNISDSLIEAKEEDVVDISYANVSEGASNNNDFNAPSSMSNNIPNTDLTNNGQNDNSNQEESDLSKFFK